MKRFPDSCRAAFVTGASSGLGDAFARMLLAEGVDVWGTSRDVARLGGLSGREPAPGEGRFHAVALDLADGAAAEEAFEAASREAGGGFDLVINNAGFGVFGAFATEPWGVWDAQLAAMLAGTGRLARAAYRSMRERNRGCLVNVSSLAAEFPLPFMAGYNVAKAGLSALSESLIFESRGTAVTIVDFRPGDYLTSFNQAMRSSPAATFADPRQERAWGCLEKNLQAAPSPERAAADLRRAVIRGRSGVVRSGSFFQARLAPFAARCLPASWVRGATALYFGI